MLGLALAVSSLFATGATATYLAAGSMIVGIYTAREQRKKAQRALDRSVKDRTIMVRDAVADRPHIFGRVRVSGQIQFPGSSGPNNAFLNWCLAIGDELDAVEAVWFGDESLGTLDGNGWTTTGAYYWSQATSTAYDAIVTAGATITLPHLVATMHAVSGVQSEVPQILLPGTPATDSLAYSTATVSGVTVVTFNSAWVGQSITLSYSYTAGIGLARADAYLGGAGQSADGYLIAQMPTVWSETDKFTGTSYISGTCNYWPDAYPSGVPEVSVVARGAKCYDPRTSTTVWTQNPALIAWHWISTHYPNETYDSASLIAAANVCDEAVAIDVGTHDRYTFDDVISSDTSPHDGLERICQAMVGSAARVAGVWYIWAGAWEEPTLALDEDDLAPGEIVIQGMAEDGALFNGIKGRYTNPTNWVEDSFPAYVSPAYVADDNDQEEVLDVDLTMIADVHRAQRVARLMLHKARQALTFGCTLEMSAYSVYPGQVVEWTIARYGWTDKPFRCLSRVYQPATGTIVASFQEDAEAIYSSSFSELTTPDASPNTNLPDPRVVAAPVVTFDSGSEFVTVLADGSQRPFLRVYWEQMDESVEKIEVWSRRADRTVWEQATVAASELAHDVYGVSANETYVVQVRAINGVGVRSAWSVSAETVAADAPINGAPFSAGIGINLCNNATVADSTTPWICDDLSGSTYTTGADRTATGTKGYFGWAKSGNTYAAYRPAPFNALGIWWDYVGGYRQRGYIYLSPGGLPVVQGTRLEVQCRGAAYNASLSLGAFWFRSDGTQINTYSSIGTQIDYAVVADRNVYLGNDGLGSYKHIFGFTEAPADAAYARVVFQLDRWVSTGACYVVVAMPYIGYARDEQVEPSSWGPGL